ncbi:hypothetical protein [Christiangramia sp.]|uniref:hypothetical protein n=1 Tax=Christiangramia sp. TaxID=1931228 RepID=UPI002611EED7|nr:hypothetical protein [Christiangramia sp.]
MKYKKLGNDLEIPKVNELPLKNKEKIKFNYYCSSRTNGNLIDLDITSKLFDQDKMYIRKSCYRIPLGEMEKCVKQNSIDHMISLGLKEKFIPDSLKRFNKNPSSKNFKKNAIPE